MRISRKRRREEAAALECAMCIGNRQLLEQLQQDVAQLAAAPARALEATRLEVADFRPGDVVVVTSPRHLSEDEVHQIGDELRQHFPAGEALVIDGGMHISVIRPEGEA